MIKRIVRNYLLVFFITLFSILTIIFSTSYIILSFVGEQYSIEEVVHRQHEQLNNICLYDSALKNVSDIYKLKIYEYVKPDVLILGSSRVLQIRPDIFSASMVNAGGSMGSIAQGYQFTLEALKIHKPKFIIIGVDFWWFNEAFNKVENINFKLPQFSDPRYQLNNYLLPFKWVYEKKIDLRQLKTYSSNCHFGAIASSRNDGYGPYGSYYYNSSIYGMQKVRDEGFLDTLKRINEGNNRFQYGKKVSEGHYKNFLMFVDFLEGNNINHTIFLPPLASKVYDSMRQKSNNYSFVWQLEKLIVEKNNGFNFHDPKISSASDCEFVDGFHGGDVIYTRLVEKMSEKNDLLSKFLNYQLINEVKEKYRGNAHGFEYKFIKNASEVDFLNLGCNKH